MKNHTITRIQAFRYLPVFSLLCAWCIGYGEHALAFDRYYTADGNCADCHGAFTDGTSPKGTIFPSNSKHEMHRATSSMSTDCDLCHTSGDNRNPFTSSSNGTVNNPGLGCSGCHVGPGLRAHHAANGITLCATCHDDPPPAPEGVKPPYYGTADTKADNPCNPIPVANTNENWSIGDFRGLDNDGNNLYDTADFSCGSYRILSAQKEGNNLRVTWLTAGGRTDVIQASATASGVYTNVSSALSIPGVGTVVTNFVETGGATNLTRFYRVKFGG